MKTASHVSSCERHDKESVLSLVIVTGSSGLIGSETVKFFHRQGFDVVGIDNNMREYFFGPDGIGQLENGPTCRLPSALSAYGH